MEVPNKAPAPGMEWSGSQFTQYHKGESHVVKVPAWMRYSINKHIDMAVEYGRKQKLNEIREVLR